jgi:lantibiotic modifying enzyme
MQVARSSQPLSIPEVLDRIDHALPGQAVDDRQLGLLDGTCGGALFYAYYYRLTQQPKHLDRLHDLLGRILAALADRPPVHSHCSGLAGIGWCLQHLVHQELVEPDQPDVFEQIDAVLFPYLVEELRAGRFDFLHDGLGAALYAVERLPDPAARACLEQAFDELAPANRAAPILAWRESATGGDAREPSYGLGLAHGVPAIIAIASLLLDHGIAAPRVRPLLRDAMRWLRATRNPLHSDCVALYPSQVTATGTAIGSRDSRLGWCNGDLAIAVTCARIGHQLHDDAELAEARAILDHTLARRTHRNGSVGDASLCHGSMGIAHVYRRAYRATGEERYLWGARRWLDETLRLGTWADGAAGFKYRMQSGYVNRYDLLQGIAGIGLGLLAALDEHTEPAWDRCLLLS